jgi:hypothetical protein
MCNLTTARKSRDEVAAHFKVRTPRDVELNVPEETLPGYPGMVSARPVASACFNPWCGAFRCASKA